MPNRKPALGFILVTLMLDTLGIGLIIPVAPHLVEQLQQGTAPIPHFVSETFAKFNFLAPLLRGLEPATIVGYLAATYCVMQFLFAPVLGAMSDRFGRRPVLLIALFGSGIDYIALALSPNLSWLFLTRAVNGLSGASMSVGTAYIADITPPAKRAAAFGMVGAAFGMGFVFGPLIGGFLGEHNIRYPFYAAGALTIMNWLYGLFILPESVPADRIRHFNWRKANPVGAFASLGRYPLVAVLAVSFFFVNLAQFGLHAVWVLYTALRYKWSPEDVGLSLFTVGIGASVVQAVVARKLIPRIGERRALVIGLGLATLAYTGYGLATHGRMIYATIVLGSLAGITQPAAQSLITRTVSPHEQGLIQGAITSQQSIAGIIGPIIGGSLFGYFTSDQAPVFLPGAPFFSSAVLAALGLVAAAIAVTRFAPPPMPPHGAGPESATPTTGPASPIPDATPPAMNE